jgi:serine/threonine-protein kinase RsbW
LPCDAASVPQVRTRLRHWLDRLRVASEPFADIQLAITEAVGNVVRHAGCDEFEVTADLTEETLTVSVSDPGLPQADPRLGVGRQIIRALTTSVVYEDTTLGTRVTMRSTATPSASSRASRTGYSRFPFVVWSCRGLCHLFGSLEPAA